MSFFVALFVWAILAAILILGVVMAVKGSFWLLIVGFLAFVFGLTKVGILTH